MKSSAALYQLGGYFWLRKFNVKCEDGTDKKQERTLLSLHPEQL